MKKLLAIIVLGLLWSGNASAEIIFKNCVGLEPMVDQKTFWTIDLEEGYIKETDEKNKNAIWKINKSFGDTLITNQILAKSDMSEDMIRDLVKLFRPKLTFNISEKKVTVGTFPNYEIASKAVKDAIKKEIKSGTFKEVVEGTCDVENLYVKKPEKSKPSKVKITDTNESFSKATLINKIKNAPGDRTKTLTYYFFAYTSSNELYYGWAYPVTMANGKIKEFYGVANSVNYKTGTYNKNCNITSVQTKTSSPYQGNFDMECPNNKKQNIVGTWTQDQLDEPGLGSGFNKNGDQVSVFFALQKEILINSINSFNFGSVQEVKKPAIKKIVKKPELKEKIIKTPEIDGSLLTIGSGSGFYINNKGYALTNNHVVDICKQMVAVVNGKEILFRVLNTDKTNDVAIIKTDLRSPSFIKINEDGAKLGEDIIAVGYPLSGRLSDSVKITRGIVSALSGMNNNSGQIQIDAALQPGNSGGPVINESGELIGIASAGLNKLLMAKEAKYIPENVNFAVSSSIVTNILKNKKVSYSTPSFFSGSYSNTELATLGDKVTLQLFCRNTRTAYNKLKRSKQYSHILIDLD